MFLVLYMQVDIMLQEVINYFVNFYCKSFRDYILQKCFVYINMFVNVEI